MFVVLRQFTNMRSVEEAAKRAQAGLVPILKRSPGFRGYYVMNAGEGAGFSVTVFESRESAEAIRDEVMSWIEKNLAEFVTEPPRITAGEVIVSVEQRVGAAGAESERGAEARPH